MKTKVKAHSRSVKGKGNRNVKSHARTVMGKNGKFRASGKHTNDLAYVKNTIKKPLSIHTKINMKQVADENLNKVKKRSPLTQHIPILKVATAKGKKRAK